MKKQTNKRIGTYLSFSISVGAGLLGAATADADIIYTKTSVTAMQGDKIWWNPKRGSAEMTHGDVPSYGGLNIVNAEPNSIYTENNQTIGNTYFGISDHSNLTRFLDTDSLGINKDINWYQNSAYILNPSISTQWSAFDQGYVAFSFLDDSGIHYGWADFSYSNPVLAGQTLTLNGYAYERIVGGAITPGDTGSVTSVPEPGTLKLGLLVMGASGIVALRRRRKAAGASIGGLQQ